MESRKLAILLLATIGLIEIPSANSRSFPSRYRGGRFKVSELSNERHWADAPLPRLRYHVARISNPLVLLLNTGRRMSDREKLPEFMKIVRPEGVNKHLRDRVDIGDEPQPVPIPRTKLSPAEMKIYRDELATVHDHGSAVLDQPYLEKRGLNDYLVIKPDYLDPFHLYVPNDIYYGHQKTCVNWLDSCNPKGIREKLLQIVDSP